MRRPDPNPTPNPNPNPNPYPYPQVSAGYHEDLALHRRVAEWRARVTPLLEEESYRKEFNIGEYGQRLLANFEASERAPPPGGPPTRERPRRGAASPDEI